MTKYYTEDYEIEIIVIYYKYCLLNIVKSAFVLQMNLYVISKLRVANYIKKTVLYVT